MTELPPAGTLSLMNPADEKSLDELALARAAGALSDDALALLAAWRAAELGDPELVDLFELSSAASIPLARCSIALERIIALRLIDENGELSEMARAATLKFARRLT